MSNAIMNRNSINALSNKSLKENLRTMLSALESGKKATWVYAHAVSQIVKAESFKEDFETIKNFADFVSMTKGAISQMTNAVDFVKREQLVSNDKKGKPDYGTITISVSNAYLLSVLSEDEFKDFTAWCESNDIEMYTLSQNNLKQAIKDWKASKERVIDTEGTEVETEETEEKTEGVKPVRVEVDTKEKALTAIVTLMKQFDISIEEIAMQA